MEALSDSFDKPFAEQQALLPPDEEIPRARVVLMGMVIHFLATGDRLFPMYYVRCMDQTSDGLVGVGDFGPLGVYINNWRPIYSNDAIGLASSRKF